MNRSSLAESRTKPSSRPFARCRDIASCRNDLQAQAYDDGPLPIGEGQTISQPEIVAMMTELIKPDKKFRVLEIGTGSGYQAAILAECVKEVDSIEVVPSLGKKAEVVLRDLGYKNIKLRIGDGYQGWSRTSALRRDHPHRGSAQRSAASAARAAQGWWTLVAPVGKSDQKLVRITRTADRLRAELITDVRFVPMTGKAQDHDPAGR